jgi:hypothetical protein
VAFGSATGDGVCAMNGVRGGSAWRVVAYRCTGSPRTPKCSRGITTQALIAARDDSKCAEIEYTGRLSNPSGHQPTYPGAALHETHAGA